MTFPQSDALVAVLRVGAALDALGVLYAVGGSFASSVQGVLRTTNDVDIVAVLEFGHIDRFVALLGDDFYVDADMIRDAIRRRSEFNVIFQPAIFKVDVFIPRLDLVARRELSRAEVFDFGDGSLRVISAEDAIVQKLHWYRLGGHVAQRQWEDALAVVKTRRARLGQRDLGWESGAKRLWSSGVKARPAEGGVGAAVPGNGRDRVPLRALSRVHRCDWTALSSGATR